MNENQCRCQCCSSLIWFFISLVNFALVDFDPNWTRQEYWLDWTIIQFKTIQDNLREQHDMTTWHGNMTLQRDIINLIEKQDIKPYMTTWYYLTKWYDDITRCHNMKKWQHNMMKLNDLTTLHVDMTILYDVHLCMIWWQDRT